MKMSLRDIGFLKLNEARLEGLIPDIQMGGRIPKLLHQTYARRELPAPIQRNINRIRALNPGWTYMFYDDADCTAFIRDHYGRQVLDRYLRINKDYGAARADLFRYLLMYRYGGVYLDIKSAADWPLDEVLSEDDRYLLSHWKNRDDTAFNGWGIHPELAAMERGEFQQWFIIAVPGHPFLKSVIEHVLDNIDRYVPGIHRTGAHAVFRVTGPIAYSLAILPLLETAPWRLIDAEDDLGLSYSIFSAIGAQEHKTVFRAHYTDLESSLTEIGLEKRAVFAAYRSAARLYKALKNQRPPELGPPH
jgi:mannosyltransferase OCH1-like enzyme